MEDKLYVVTTLYTGHDKTIVHSYGLFSLTDARKAKRNIIREVPEEDRKNLMIFINKVIDFDPETGAQR